MVKKMLIYGTTKKSNAQITLEQCTMTTTINSVKSITLDIIIQNCPYMYWNIYATDAHTLLLHV